MRSLVLLVLLSCGTTLDGGIHAETCGTPVAAGDPICKTGDRCNSATDCIPACTSVGCLEGACTYRTATCGSAADCAAKPTLAACFACTFGTAAVAPALSACLCTACAAACGGVPLCGGSAALTDACVTCAIDALVHPGLCSSDARFQDDCFAGDLACRRQAQGIVACRR